MLRIGVAALFLAMLVTPAGASEDEGTGDFSNTLIKQNSDPESDPLPYLAMRFYNERGKRDFSFQIGVSSADNKIISRWRLPDGTVSAKSFMMSGLGMVKLYADANFEQPVRSIMNDDLDEKARSEVLKFGSVEFCPGVTLYDRTKFKGEEFTQVVCRPVAATSYCFKPETEWMGIAKSLRTNELIKAIHLFSGADCSGEAHSYTASADGHNIESVKLTVEEFGHFASYRVDF